MIRTYRPNKKLTEIIENLGKEKLVSVEINPYKPFDLNVLAKIKPSFCSVLWIANQNDPENPKLLPPVIVAKDLVRKGYVVLVHIPGIFYSKEKIRNILLILKEYGVSNIFAMRGGGPWLKIDHCEFPFAQDFIGFIRNEFGSYFEVVVAGFPQGHPATHSMEEEMFFLRRKIEAGATLICTHACMSPYRSYNDFVRIKKIGSNVDKNVYKNALEIKRSQHSHQYGRKWTKYLLRELLENDLTVGLHIFTQNRLELAKNILIETEADNYKADLRKMRQLS